MNSTKHSAATAMLIAGLAAFGSSAKAASPTTTTLTLSPQGSVAAGMPVTLTAAVTAGSSPVTPGLVLFCNAAAPRCVDAAVLGAAQLTSAGKAAIKFRFGPGVHSIAAAFQGTKSFAKSSSAAKGVTVPAGTPVATVSTVKASGVAGNFVLTGNVSATSPTAPTGTVTFLDANHGNAAAGSGSLGAPTSTIGFALGFHSTYPAQAGPVITADFNNDGIPDYAVNSDNLYVALGNGDGTFVQTFVYAGGGAAVADFNSDGIPDIATSVNGFLSILLGKGDGTFTASTTNIHAEGIAIGDFDRDGIPDLALFNFVPTDATGSVIILTGNGDGTFTLRNTYPTGDPSAGLVVADFNGDGNLDLVAGDGFPIDQSNIAAAITVFLGHGDGSFNSLPQIKFPEEFIGPPIAMIAGDFNGDGKPDLVWSYSDNLIIPFVGKGDGTFTMQTPVPIKGGSPSGFDTSTYQLLTADANGDGKLDVVVAREAALTVLYGSGTGSFTPVDTYLNGLTASAAVADFDGDGQTDVVLSTFDINEVEFYKGTISSSASASAMNVFLQGSGTHNLTASYSGDPGHLPGTSQPVSVSNQTAPPVFHPAPGIYAWTQNISITDATPNASIYYTLDGSTPSTSSTLYTAPVQVTWYANINAIAVSSGASNSSIVNGVFNIERPLPAPQFSLPPGSYAAPQTVTITDDPSYCSHATCVVYYTLDGSTPTVNSKKYIGPISLTVAGTTTIKAIGTSHHFTQSPVASAAYTLH